MRGHPAPSLGSDRLGQTPAAHQKADLLDSRAIGRDLANELSAAHDEDAVGDREEFLELGRDEKDRAAGVALLQHLLQSHSHMQQQN